MIRAFGFSTLLIGLYHALVRPQLLQSTLSAEEVNAAYEGDLLIPQPTLVATRAINIKATPAQIWPWLAQMGRERTGYYGTDKLTNWNIPSVRYLRQDIQPLAVGAMLDDGLQVLKFSTSDFMLVGGFNMPNDIGGRSDFLYLYQLVPLTDYMTRLLIRTRVRSDGWQGWVFDRIYEVMDFRIIMARLEGIKARAETHQPQILARETLATVPTQSE